MSSPTSERHCRVTFCPQATDGPGWALREGFWYIPGRRKACCVEQPLPCALDLDLPLGLWGPFLCTSLFGLLQFFSVSVPIPPPLSLCCRIFPLDPHHYQPEPWPSTRADHQDVGTGRAPHLLPGCPGERWGLTTWRRGCVPHSICICPPGSDPRGPGGRRDCAARQGAGALWALSP